MLLTAIIFIIVLGILIFVHELGHFIFAKRAKMRVEEFGFGFPPRLWGKKKGNTVYSINWIPFGGFVKILGEDGADKDKPDSFASKPLWPRFYVLVSGVLMNFLLAAFLLILVNFTGLRIGLDETSAPLAIDKQIQITEIAAGSPAERAGLKILDEVRGLKLAGKASITLTDIRTLQEIISQNAGHDIKLLIKRSGQNIEVSVQPRINPPAGEGALGIGLALTGIIPHPWYESLWRGPYDATIMLMNIVVGYAYLFKVLFTTGHLLGGISGPIGIASMTGQAARIGLSFLLQFMAMISINLAVLNVLPFPALDGGRILFLFIEKLKGSPINKKFEGLVNAIGFSLLILLMVYITIKDVVKLF